MLTSSVVWGAAVVLITIVRPSTEQQNQGLFCSLLLPTAL